MPFRNPNAVTNAQEDRAAWAHVKEVDEGQSVPSASRAAAAPVRTRGVVPSAAAPAASSEANQSPPSSTEPSRTTGGFQRRVREVPETASARRLGARPDGVGVKTWDLMVTLIQWEVLEEEKLPAYIDYAQKNPESAENRLSDIFARHDQQRKLAAAPVPTEQYSGSFVVQLLGGQQPENRTFPDNEDHQGFALIHGCKLLPRDPKSWGGNPATWLSKAQSQEKTAVIDAAFEPPSTAASPAAPVAAKSTPDPTPAPSSAPPAPVGTNSVGPTVARTRVRPISAAAPSGSAAEAPQNGQPGPPASSVPNQKADHSQASSPSPSNPKAAQRVLQSFRRQP